MINFLLDNAPNDSNKSTMVSDAHLDSVPMPLLPNAACGINTNIKNDSRARNSSKNGQKMMDSTTDDSSTNSANNTPLSPEPLDINIDDHSMLTPSHMKRAHSTQNTKKQIDIRTFGKGLRGQLNDKNAAPVKQSIPCISMDEEEISILSEQGNPQQLHPSNKLAHSYISDSDETMQSHDQDTTMESWIPVSSKKERSKQAQKSDTASDHTEADPWQSTPEQLDYPQPVSKRISIGLPINPNVISKEKATATKNT